MVKLSLISAVVWTLLGELALQGLRAPLTVIPAVVAPGLDAGLDRAAAAATAVTDELRWGHERRARRWREAAALQRRRHVASITPEIADCGYRPSESWTSEGEPHKQWAIIREDVAVGRKKRGRIKAANPLHKGCSAATAVDVDVDVETVVVE